MPVSKISSVGFSSSNVGGSRWIGQRSSTSNLFVLPVDHVAEHVEEAPQRPLPDRHGDRNAQVDHVGATGDAVRRVHRHGADGVVAEMLLHLGDEIDPGPAVRARRPRCEGVVDLRQLVGEDGIDDDALDLDDLADVRRRDGLGHEAPGLLLQSRRSVYRLRDRPADRDTRHFFCWRGLRRARRAARPAAAGRNGCHLLTRVGQQGDLLRGRPRSDGCRAVLPGPDDAADSRSDRDGGRRGDATRYLTRDRERTGMPSTTSREGRSSGAARISSAVRSTSAATVRQPSQRPRWRRSRSRSSSDSSPSRRRETHSRARRQLRSRSRASPAISSFGR